MPNIQIDGKDYDFDQLSNEAKAHLVSLQFVDAELARLQAQAAALRTARMASQRLCKRRYPPCHRATPSSRAN